MTKTLSKEELDKVWKWIERDLPPDFWKQAGTIFSNEERQRRFDDIPDVLKSLAYSIIMMARCNKDHGIGGKSPKSCLLFRCMLYELHQKLKEDGIDLHLPFAWYCDGPMIAPEWIVRITNGLISWSCDDSVTDCGGENFLDGGPCRYYTPLETQRREQGWDICPVCKTPMESYMHSGTLWECKTCGSTRDMMMEGRVRDIRRTEEPCPCCGEQLYESWDMEDGQWVQNSLMQVLFGGAPGKKWCRNKKCQGWYCHYDGRWHPYGTSCSVVSVRNGRSGTAYPENYEEAMERKVEKCKDCDYFGTVTVGNDKEKCPICGGKAVIDTVKEDKEGLE